MAKSSAAPAQQIQDIVQRIAWERHGKHSAFCNCPTLRDEHCSCQRNIRLEEANSDLSKAISEALPVAHQALYEALSAAADFNAHKSYCGVNGGYPCNCGATKALLAARAALALADAAAKGGSEWRVS